MANSNISRIGGAGCPSRRAATNFSGDPAADESL